MGKRRRIKRKKAKGFISVRGMKRRYPENNFKITGEFYRSKPVQAPEGFDVEIPDGTVVRVKNTGDYKRSRYRVFSYIHVKEDEYIAVLKRDWRALIIALIAAALLLIGGYLFWKMNQGPDIDPALKDYVSGLQRPENLDETQILMPGITSLVMDADTDFLLNSTLYNPKDNPCYFQYRIVDEKGEELYQSKLIPPGKGVEEVKLNKTISEGIYNVTIEIKTYDLNDYETELNGAEIDSELRALK